MMNTISNKKNYIFTLVSGLSGVVFSIILNLVTIPISLNYWKADRYGIWVLLTSTLMYLGMTNLGLNTAAGVLMGKNPKISDKMKILKRSLLILMLSAGIILAAFYALNMVTKEWINLIGKIPANLKDETYSACFVLVVFYLISLPFSLLSAVYTGFQKLYIDNIFNIALNIINFLVLVLVIILKGNLIYYSALWGISLVVFNITKYLFFYFSIYRKLPKEPYSKNLTVNIETEYKTIFSTGMRFFFIGIASTIVWSSDILVISNFISIQSVVPYFITFKLFSIVYGVIFQVNNSIMPLLGKEYGHNNIDWVSKIYSYFLVLMILIGGATWVGSITFFRDIVTLWTSSSNFSGLIVVIALGGYSYLLSMSVLNFGIVNTLNYQGIVPFVSWGEALVKIVFSIWLGKIWGLAGVAAGTFLGSLCSPTWILPILIMKRSAGKIIYNFSLLSKHFVLAILPCIIISVIIQVSPINMLTRLIFGVLVAFLYLWLSYIVFPIDCRVFFFRHISKILVRIGFKPLNYS
jgi:O-antigen/teichoic acid export membrane protein